MDNKKLTQAYREVMGDKLKEFRESRGVSTYAVRKKTGLSGAQINDIESGASSYTIDSFLLYLMGSDLYLYFAEKSDKPDDLDDLAKKAIDRDPMK